MAGTAGPTGLRTIVPLLAAVALTVLAVFTVRSAGCDDPGHYEWRGDVYELVGGCLAPGDIVVPQVSAPQPAAPVATPPLPAAPVDGLPGPARD